jgi:hypothetical protein
MRKEQKKKNKIKMQLKVPQQKKPEDKKKRNHIVVVDDDAPLDNIDEISSATTTVRPDS